MPFSPYSLKVGIMNVSTRIQSLVLENNMKGKLVLTEIEKKNTYILFSYILCFLSFLRGTERIHKPYLHDLLFAPLTFFIMYAKK